MADREGASSTGIVAIVVIFLIVVLLLIFGRGLFSGGKNGGVNIEANVSVPTTDKK